MVEHYFWILDDIFSIWIRFIQIEQNVAYLRSGVAKEMVLVKIYNDLAKENVS
jgi:hypothetical protein